MTLLSPRPAISRLLFAFAQSSAGGFIIGWSFEYMSFAIPVDRLFESDLVVAFHHPKPVAAVHVLIVPKRKIATILHLTDTDAPVLADIFKAAQAVVEHLQLMPDGYRLIVNGGDYQDVGQIHWHLLAGQRSELM